MKEKLWYSCGIGAVITYFFSIIWQGSFMLTANPILSFIAPVNKSLWESFKILLIPFILYAVVEFYVLKPYLKQFVAAKLLAFYLMLIIGVALYYSFRFFDLSPSLTTTLVVPLAFAAGFIGVYKLYYANFDFSKLFIPSLLMIVVTIAVFCFFTYNPPQADLFVDPLSNEYGIVEYYLHRIIDLNQI